mgnify:CR=1 FL=1
MKAVKAGREYIDFIALSWMDWILAILSGLIEGKMALIDLWVSWCRTCWQNAMSMIPVYEKYKDLQLLEWPVKKAHLGPGVECASARSCLILSIIPQLRGHGDVLPVFVYGME